MRDGNRFMRFGCLVLAGFMVLACGAVILYALAGLKDLPDALDNAGAFLNQLNKNEVDRAYASTTPEYQKGMPFEQFRETVAKYPLLTKPSKRKLGNLKTIESSKEPRALVEFKLTDPSNASAPPLTLSMTLKKVGDAWKVETLTFP